jgi:hypothetical protein
MNYDANKYRALGVGETVTQGDYFLSAEGDVNPCTSITIGNCVSGDEYLPYLRLIPNATIQKDVFPSGAARSAAEGRGRFDLIPYEAMLSLAKRYEMGAKVFGPKNWEAGQPLSRLLSSLRRHAHQISYDYSEDHAGAVLWNAAAFVTMVERMRAGILPKSLDDIGYFINEEATKR